MTLHQSMKLIGIGDNGQESLLPQYRQWITDCEVLVGGGRVLDFSQALQAKKSSLRVVFHRSLKDYLKKRERPLF